MNNPGSRMQANQTFRAAASAGFGLIELIVGLVIGAVLLLGLSQVFSTSRNTYQASEGLARAQENSRFAMDFLQRDVRMAGHMGCVNDIAHFLASPPELFSHFLDPNDRQPKVNAPVWANAPFDQQFNVAIEGYEATGTTPGNTLNLSGYTDPLGSGAMGAASDWSPSLPAALSTAIVGSGAGKVVKGSDIIVLRFFGSTSAPVTNINLATGAITVPVAPTNFATLIKANSLYGIADCTKASVFQASTAPNAGGTFTTTTATPLNRSGFLGGENYVAKELHLYTAQTYVYYIGMGAGGGPSLYRLNFSSGAGVPEELVEGIENMQLLYGRDTNAGNPDGAIDIYQTATDINKLATADPNVLWAAWRRVGAVRVSFLSRSVDRAATNAAVVSPSVLNVSITPPANDSRVRQVYTSTIALRNRLFGN